MKKILSIAVAMIMVMALSVSVFANVDLTGEIGTGLNENFQVAIPEGVDVSDGATVTVNVKGTSDNTAVRFYLTDPADVARVTDVAVVEVVDGAFEATFDLYCDLSGAYGGSSEPSVLQVKGPDYATPLANTTFEVLEVVADVAAPAETHAETPAETPAEIPAETPAETTPAAPANTGIVLAVLPMAVAAAAIAVSKKR